MARRSLATRLLLSLLLLVALLGVVELALRVGGAPADDAGFRFRRIAPAVAEDRQGRYEAHVRRYYALAPRFRHSPTHLGRDATGDWPFRGRPPEPAPPGLLRVALVGDSVVYGSALDAADMPASRLADALARRGWTPDRVAVVSLGVPGYSTVQLGLLLDEALAATRYDAVVLWPAAWNDQAPALVAPDAALLAGLADTSPLEWLRERSRLAALVRRREKPADIEAIVAAWKRGEPQHGWRVPAEEVGPNVAALLRRCADAGAPAVVLASAHPPQTAAENPRTRLDAAAVAAAAREAGAPLVDAQAVLDESGLDAGLLFVDYVHPSPAANALLGEALASALHPLLEAGRAAGPDTAASPAGGATLSIVDVQPAHVPVLGDETVRVTLSGWTRGEPLPALVVGGAPLIGVQASGEHELQGTLMANAAGPQALVVQSAAGCAWLPEAIAYREPEIALEAGPDQPSRLLVSARPGDVVRVMVAAGRRAAPDWSPRGAYELDDSARALPGDRTADAGGLAAWSIDRAPAGRVLVQALVAPAGETADAGLAARWTGVVELSGPDGATAPEGESK